MTDLDTTTAGAVDSPRQQSPQEPGLPTQTGAARRRWKRLGWVAALFALVAVAGVAWWVGSSSQSPQQAAARAEEPEASWVTAPVEFRVLSSTIITRGDVQPESSTNITVPVSVEGTAVVTKSVLGAGDKVVEGDRVVEVSGRPVFVFQGNATVYRSLQPGMEGDDVTAVQAALARLGHPVEATGLFDEATKAAVTLFYADAGYDPIPTSATYPADLAAAERAVTEAETAADAARADLANAADGPAASEIAAADAAIDAAENALADARATRIEAVDAAEIALDVAEASRDETHARPGISVDEYNNANIAVHNAQIALANTIRDNDAAVEAAEDQLEIALLARTELDETVDTTELQTAVDTAETAVSDAENALAELQRVNGPTIAQGEVVFVTTTPTRVLVTASSGPTSNTPSNPNSDPNGDATGTPLLSLASGDPVVTASIRTDQAELVAVGHDVTLLDETSNTSYPATVTAIADEPVANASGQLGHPLTITTNLPLDDDLVGANLRVTLTAASTGTEQLVVPVAAVTSAADGTARVNILDPNGIPVEVEVIAGLSADGFIAVEPVHPAALDADSAVIVGR